MPCFFKFTCVSGVRMVENGCSGPIEFVIVVGDVCGWERSRVVSFDGVLVFSYS